MDESIQFPGSEFGLDGELEIRSTFDQVYFALFILQGAITDDTDDVIADF
jgi:hypothetical protein